MKELLMFLGMFIAGSVVAQQFPGEGDNIDFLITSGGSASKQVGDDDHQQVVFFLLPKDVSSPFYIRIYDPETSGSFDEKNGGFDTETTFTCYGGAKTHSDSTSRGVGYQRKPKGTKLTGKSFGVSEKYDQKWYVMGPFSPKQGEYSEAFEGYVFKLVVQTSGGNDVNLYRLALSSNKTSNVDIPGGNIFTYEYSFRLKSKAGAVAHVYPYIDENVVSITQNNFDFDQDGKMYLYSVVKKGERVTGSHNGNWKSSKHKIVGKEKKKCLDLQIRKHASWHNDMVMYVTNQYDQPVPFFASPIGGNIKPKFSFSRAK